MLVQFTCPHCGVTLEADGSSGGGQAPCPGCAEMLLVPAPSIQPGTTIGGFYVERKIGEGGMGQIYVARQLSVDREVALKVLPQAMTSKPELVERFLQEIHLAGRLEHPNIVAVHDAGEDEGFYYFAMSYVRGLTLEVLLKLGPIPEGEALAIVRKIAGALSYAWNRHQLLHRDVKPANLMLDEDDEPKLLDMGLAKSFAMDVDLTSTGLIVGTPAYMSPEQADPLADVTFRSDMYSLGATLFHMVTGSAPYDGTSARDILRRKVRSDIPSARESLPSVSEASDALIKKMMAKRPEDRFASWEELISAIGAAMERGSAPVSAVTPEPKVCPPPVAPLPAKSRTRRKRHKGWRIAACVLAVLVLGRIVRKRKAAAGALEGDAPARAQGSGDASRARGGGDTDAQPVEALVPAPAELLTRLNKLVEARLREQMASEAVGKELCAGLALPWPVRAPTRSPEEIAALADKRTEALVEQKHPLAVTTARIRREAEARFRLYQPGDQVSLVKRGGRGPLSHVSGMFVKRDGASVRIGSRTVQLMDVDPGERVHFIPELSEQKIRVTIDTGLEELHRARSELRRGKLPEATDSLYRDSGYVLVHGRWQAGTELYARAVEAEKEVRGEALRREVYLAHGLTERGGRWVTVPGSPAE